MITEPVISMYQLVIGFYVVMMVAALIVKLMVSFEEKARPGAATPKDEQNNQYKYNK